jgi:hypothetical protein
VPGRTPEAEVKVTPSGADNDTPTVWLKSAYQISLTLWSITTEPSTTFIWKVDPSVENGIFSGMLFRPSP